MNVWAARILRCRDAPLTPQERVEAWTELLRECPFPPPEALEIVSKVDRETIRVDCARIYNGDSERVQTWLEQKWLGAGMPYMQGFHFAALFALESGLSDEDVVKWIALFGLRVYMPMNRRTLSVSGDEEMHLRDLGPMNEQLERFWSCMMAHSPCLVSHLERFPVVFPSLMPCYVCWFAGTLASSEHLARIWDDMIALESIQSGLGTIYITCLLTILLCASENALLACQDDMQMTSLLTKIISHNLNVPLDLTRACALTLRYFSSMPNMDVSSTSMPNV